MLEMLSQFQKNILQAKIKKRQRNKTWSAAGHGILDLLPCKMLMVSTENSGFLLGGGGANRNYCDAVENLLGWNGHCASKQTQFPINFKPTLEYKRKKIGILFFGDQKKLKSKVSSIKQWKTIEKTLRKLRTSSYHAIAKTIAKRLGRSRQLNNPFLGISGWPVAGRWWSRGKQWCQNGDVDIDIILLDFVSGFKKKRPLLTRKSWKNSNVEGYSTSIFIHQNPPKVPS